MNGPWLIGYLVSMQNSTDMSCYNPLQLPFLSSNDKIIYFACTFTAMWTAKHATTNQDWNTCLFGQINGQNGCAKVVLNYEYNNLVFKLDLSLLNYTN
eukprot:UN12128